MELSGAMIVLLRDEAYAYLAQQALVAQLGARERERAAAEAKGPGLLARHGSRATFAQTNREGYDQEAVLRDRLTQLTGIVEWLYPIIRQEVSSYFAGVSPEYCRLLKIAARLDDWGRAYATIPEHLTAFARDLRGVRGAAEAAPKASGAFAYELAVLRESAERLAQVQLELYIIEQAALANAPAAVAAQLAFPALPDLKRVSWVSRLAVIPPAKALVEVTRVEAEVRAFLLGPAGVVAGQLEATRRAGAKLVNRTLEDYWDVLREHARAHYVEERGIEEVIAMLTERYVDSDIPSGSNR